MNDGLMDIREIKFDDGLNDELRMKAYIEQIKNPYHFKYKNIEVTLVFTGEKLLEDRLIGFLKSKLN